MNRAVFVCAFCAVLSSSWLENVDAHAQLRIEYDGASIVQSIETLSKVVEGLQTEIKMQSSVLSNLVSKEELESMLLNNLATKSDMQIQKIDLQNLAAQAAMHDNSLSNLQASVDELKAFLINPNVKQDEPAASLSTLETQSSKQTILLNQVGANFENQTSLLNTFVTKAEMQVSNLTNVEAQAPTVSDGLETSAEGMGNLTASKAVEGIIASTYNGIVIIPLDSREQRTISNKRTFGVAFNWQSRKVYWIEYPDGLKISDLDGSSHEVLISDPNLRGLAVDQITGNIYHGVSTSDTVIRVCDSMGKKCVTVAWGVGTYYWDIALYPSEGLMFWSNPFSEKSVTRASMYGAMKTMTVLENIAGLYIDEPTEKLYWVNNLQETIGHSDLNGYNPHVLLNTTIQPTDIAVDGDTLYFGAKGQYGVFSATSNGQVSSIANTTGPVYHIALFGRNMVSSRPNPCENSPCANLCVLSRFSYRCL